jgi:hypothetical protein
MFAAVSNLDVSWPDPSVQGNDQLQKFVQASNQYIVPITTTNDSATVGNLTNTGFAYIDVAVAPNGIIAFAPFVASNLAFYNINTNLVSTGVAKPGNMESVAYSSYDNKFYYSLAASTGGIYSLSADSTGSALSSVISGTANRVYFTINGTEGWIAPSTSVSKVLSLNLISGVTTAVGQDVSASAGVHTPTVAPNGLVCFGTSLTTCRFYEPSTDTTGTFSGTVAADSSYNWALARDGFLYSVPRFTNTSVYRLDPYKKSISTVFTGSPYTSGYKRGMWVATDGSICTIQAANTMISYDPITNTATTQPFTFTYNSNNTHQGVTYLDGSMYFLNANNQVLRVNNINTRNLFNRAWQGNNAKRGGYN